MTNELSRSSPCSLDVSASLTAFNLGLGRSIRRQGRCYSQLLLTMKLSTLLMESSAQMIMALVFEEILKTSSDAKYILSTKQ